MTDYVTPYADIVPMLWFIIITDSCRDFKCEMDNNNYYLIPGNLWSEMEEERHTLTLHVFFALSYSEW